MQEKNGKKNLSNTRAAGAVMCYSYNRKKLLLTALCYEFSYSIFKISLTTHTLQQLQQFYIFSEQHSINMEAAPSISLYSEQRQKRCS